MERKKLTQDEFGHQVIVLMQKVYDSGYIPDVIAPVMKGGAIPAFSIAAFHNPVWYSPIDIARHGKERDVIFPLEPFLSYNITGWEVLVVEDDNITGNGLVTVCKALAERGAKPRTASVFVSEQTAQATDFYAAVVSEFPDYPFKPFHMGDKEHFTSRRYLLPVAPDFSLDLDYFSISGQPFGRYFKMPCRSHKMQGVDRSGIAPKAAKVNF